MNGRPRQVFAVISSVEEHVINNKVENTGMVLAREQRVRAGVEVGLAVVYDDVFENAFCKMRTYLTRHSAHE